jgi:hypothetical protein
MAIHTASEGMSLARQLETESAAFYEEVVKTYPENAAELLGFAAENRKNIASTERVYYGVISDAIEGSYAFNLEPADYALDTAVKPGAAYADLLKQSVKMEEQITRFYTDAAAQSKSLLADVPRAFELLARKRNTRIGRLERLIQEGRAP